MKKVISLILITLAGTAMFSFIKLDSGTYGAYSAKRFHTLNNNGASAGNTGAPGEGNCTNCHAGSVQQGSGFNILSFGDGVTEYAPGQTYSVTLTMDDASNKNGFQLTALKSSDNLPAGTLAVTDATRTQFLNGQAGKQYIGHRAAGSSSSTWSFSWTAPSANVGNVVFYVATNKTNSNGQTSGDVIRLSQHTINGPQGSASLTPYELIEQSLKIGYNKENHAVQIAFNSLEKEELKVNITNISGQSVLLKSLGSSYPGENEKTLKLGDNLPAGIYVVNFFVGNKAYGEKILIEK